MPLWSSLLLAIAVSLDSAGAGMTYGMRGIRIPVSSLAIIGVCTGGLMVTSMAAGQLLASLTTRAGTLGGLLLVAIGSWQLLQGWRNYLGRLEVAGPLLRLRLPLLGVVVQVLRDPVRADVDHSGSIDTGESLLLGTALGLDAFVAGFGAAMVGFPLWVVPLVTAACVGFICAGAWLGARTDLSRNAAFAVPGLLLIAIGLLKI